MEEVKTLASAIKSEVPGKCECCGEPMLDLADQLARDIFALLPANALPASEVQKAYDTARDFINAAMALVADTAIDGFIDEMELEGRVVN